MKLLFTVEFYDPSTGGSQEVIKQIAERLVRRGHEVTVATTSLASRSSERIRGVRVRGFDVRGSSVRGITGDVEGYQSFLRAFDGEVIFNYAAQTWTTDLMFPLLAELRCGKVFAPLGYSKLGEPRYREYYAMLPRCLAAYDRLVYTSAHYQDWEFGKAHGLSANALVVPNGASEEEFSKPPLGFREQYSIRARYMALTVSNHYLAKGHIFTVRAFRRMRRDDATLVIIGERPPAHSWYSCEPFCRFVSKVDRRVKVFHNVPREWVVSAYQEADLFLFGSRVECAPLVMYEAFASGTPFVARPVGNVRDHADHVSIVDSPDDMAATANRLLDHEDERLAIADMGRSLWKSACTWETITDRYEEIFSSVAAGKKAR